MLYQMMLFPVTFDLVFKERKAPLFAITNNNSIWIIHVAFGTDEM